MEFIFTDGCNTDFNELCNLLDDSLNQLVGGEKNRTQYVQYNKLDDIHDVVIAYDRDIPVGCASFKLFEKQTAEVKRVFVKNEYRGKGISKQLMELLTERAKEKKFEKFVLETGKPLVTAFGLYTSIGFSIIPNYGQYKDMPDSICMEKLLIESKMN